MNEKPDLSPHEQELIDAGEVFAEDDPIYVALREAARLQESVPSVPSVGGNRTSSGVGRSAQLTEVEEPVADAIRRSAGLGPTVVRREKAIPVLVHIQPSTREALRVIAEGYDFWHNGQGNLSKLLEAIGTGKLRVTDRP